MGQVVALPARGEVFADARGEGRAVRVSWHHDNGVAVLSLWRGAVCTGTLQVAAADVPALVASLTTGLAEGYRRDSAVQAQRATS
ncbi:hypothetical protein [Georgenia sunbinii]|uniref:hypothetical protein n=1 Tax=Georgenia sunbinii TaxID=3117728 RepID=UPI002F263843